MAKKPTTRKTTKSGKPAARRKAVKSNVPAASDADLIKYYKDMLMMRRFKKKQVKCMAWA